MKRLLFIIASVFLLSQLALAFQTSLWLSSNTSTADTTQNLCKNYNSGGSVRGVFHGVCLNTATAGTLTIYNSSGTANNPIAAMDTNRAVPCNYYDVEVSSGLTYTNSATANVTILYQCY